MKMQYLFTAALAALIIVGADMSAQAQRGGPPGGGRTPGSDRGSSSSQSSRNTQSQVVAVADTRSNSVVISAPAELLPSVEALIAEVDNSNEKGPEVRVFPLRYADAEEMATLVEDVFDDSSSGSRSFFGGSRSGSTNRLQVTAEHDVRTNSVVVSADGSKMPLIAQMIASLDQDPARDQKVYVYNLENADAASVAEILQSVVDEQSRRGSGSGSSSSRRSSSSSGSPFSRSTSGSSSRSNTSGFGGSGSSGFGGGSSSSGGGGR